MKKVLIIILFVCASVTGESRPAIENLQISKGTSDKVIVLSWRSDPADSEYIVFRSNKTDGPYSKIFEGTINFFIDRNNERGVQYYYRLYATSNGIMSDEAEDYGYTSPVLPRGCTPEEILKTRNKSKPKPEDENQKRQWEHQLSVMDHYYENILTISIIMFIGKIYVRKGALLVYKDFNKYTINYWKKTIVVYKEGMHPIKFYSKRLFRFLRRCRNNGIEEKDILPRLIKNAIFFCVRRDNTVTTDQKGVSRVVPVYEALGMSTEYFKDYKRWRSNTIVFGSDTKDLDELINQNRPK